MNCPTFEQILEGCPGLTGLAPPTMRLCCCILTVMRDGRTGESTAARSGCGLPGGFGTILSGLLLDRPSPEESRVRIWRTFCQGPDDGADARIVELGRGTKTNVRSKPYPEDSSREALFHDG